MTQAEPAKRISKTSWPKRAVVTAGMPYGNKPLHFGHIGGVFVPADCFARFLRDRLGSQNVLFVSGTDCFGSPINEGYRKLVDAGEFSGSIADYVKRNHDAQKATLDAFDISLSIFEGSGIGVCGEKHAELTSEFITKLYENGHLTKRESKQFYDAQANTFLNGRQVVGHCPVQGCKSEKAYADECDLGHQYAPEELIAPKSTLTDSVPEMRSVANWYFDLPDFAGIVRDYVTYCNEEGDRDIVSQTISEFLAPPIIFVNVKDDAEERYRALADRLPAHTFREPAKGKSSFELEFTDIEARDTARDILMDANIRIRTGKTLVPFRITGNIDWGVPAPKLADVTDDLTVWCWPESLWAPISFTQAYAAEHNLPEDDWKRFWKSSDAKIYQFIGQDNLYFYGVAQPALWSAVQPGDACLSRPTDGMLRQTELVANHHLLFMDKKASSSGSIKPPTADELLEHYTVEQLRAHFLALALDQKSVGFKPKPYESDPAKRDNPRMADPVLKEGALLTKVFNRLARSCLYDAKNNFGCRMPLGTVTPPVSKMIAGAMDSYEQLMGKVDLHSVMTLMDDFIRSCNKHWSDGIRAIENTAKEAGIDTREPGPDANPAIVEELTERRRVLLCDCFCLLRVCALLMHPVVPAGTEKIASYLSFDEEAFFNWDAAFDTCEGLSTAEEREMGFHAVRELPPRTDFFEAHESQFKK